MERARERKHYKKVSSNIYFLLSKNMKNYIKMFIS